MRTTPASLTGNGGRGLKHPQPPRTVTRRDASLTGNGGRGLKLLTQMRYTDGELRRSPVTVGVD